MTFGFTCFTWPILPHRPPPYMDLRQGFHIFLMVQWHVYKCRRCCRKSDLRQLQIEHFLSLVVDKISSIKHALIWLWSITECRWITTICRCWMQWRMWGVQYSVCCFDAINKWMTSLLMVLDVTLLVKVHQRQTQAAKSRCKICFATVCSCFFCPLARVECNWQEVNIHRCGYGVFLSVPWNLKSNNH